jgi:hypothetical protein
MMRQYGAGGFRRYWARVDLGASGIELYVTPLDPEAVAQGWQYRLRGIAEVVQREQLAVAVNAALVIDNHDKIHLRTIIVFGCCHEGAERDGRQLFLSAHAWLAWNEEEGMSVRDVGHHAIPSRSRLFDSWRGSFQAPAP